MPNYRTATSAAVMDARDIDRSTVGAFVMRGGAACLRGAAALGAIAFRRPVDALGIAAAALASGAVLVNALFLQAAPHPAPMLAVKPRPVASGEITSSLPAPAPARRSVTTAIAARPEAPTVAVKADVPAAAPLAAAPPVAAPAVAARTRAHIVSDIQRELSRRGFFDGPVDGVYGPKTDAAIRDFEQAAGLKASAQPDDALLRLITRSAAHAAPPPAPAAHAAPAPAPVPRPPVAIRTPTKQPTTASKRVLSVQRALADFGYGQVAPTGVLGAETKSAIERFERERKLPVTGQISDRLVRELAAVTGRPLE